MLAALLPLSPAAAVDQTIVVPGLDFPEGPNGVPTGLLEWRRCDDFSVQASFEDVGADLRFTIRTNDDPTEALGDYAMQLTTDDDTAAGVMGYTATPTDATVVAGLRVRMTSGLNGAHLAYYLPPDPDAEEYWLGVNTSFGGGGSGWIGLDGAGGTTFTWYPISTETGQSGPALPGASTLSSFAGSHGGNADSQGNGGAYVGWVLGCGVGAVGLDRLEVGAPGSARVFDFERVRIGLTRPASPAVVVAGRQIRVSTTFDFEETTIPEARVVLQAKPFGASGFSNVGTGVIRRPEDTVIPARVTAAPRRRTVYRFYFAGNTLATPRYSPTRTVDVRTALTIAAPARATANRAFRVTGRSTPAKPGTAVTLQRKVGNRWVRVAGGRVARNGTYAFTARSASRATWTLRVVGGGGTGNLAGTSPSRRVVIGS